MLMAGSATLCSRLSHRNRCVDLNLPYGRFPEAEGQRSCCENIGSIRPPSWRPYGQPWGWESEREGGVRLEGGAPGALDVIHQGFPAFRRAGRLHALQEI